MMNFAGSRGGGCLIFCGILLFLFCHQSFAQSQSNSQNSSYCQGEYERVRQATGGTSLVIHADKKVRVGDYVRASWTNLRLSDISTPTYLILATENHVRFAADYKKIKRDHEDRLGKASFFALPSDLKAPHNIPFQVKKLRAFFPMHSEHILSDGKLFLEPLKSGLLNVSWAIASKPRGCPVKIIREARHREFYVDPGKASLTLQDLFSSNAPNPAALTSKRFAQLGSRAAVLANPSFDKKTFEAGDFSYRTPVKKIIVSSDNSYRMLVYAKRYEVYDNRTGERLIERGGLEPNFSPTGRYVVARLREDARTTAEVVDVLARRVVGEVYGATLVWTEGDAFLVSTHIWYGLIDVWNLPIGRRSQVRGISNFYHTMNGCKACHMSINNTTVTFDLDNGVVKMQSSGAHFTEELASGHKVELSGKYNEDFKASAWRVPGGWWGLSHLPPDYEHNKDFYEKKKIKIFLALHEEFKNVSSKEKNLQIERDATRYRKALSHYFSRLNLNFPVYDFPTHQLISEYQEKLKAANVDDMSFQDAERFKSKALRSLRRRVSRFDKRLARTFRHMPDTDCFQYYEPDSTKYLDAKVPTRNIMVYWGLVDALAWKAGKSSYLVLRNLCVQGSGAFPYHSLVLVERRGRRIQMRSLTEVFAGGVFKNNNGDSLLNYGNPLIRAVSPRRIALYSDFYDRLVVYDIVKKRIVMDARDAPDAYTPLDMFESKDGRFLVSVHRKGKFNIFSYKRKKVVLSGRIVDDEIILHDQNGYYASTPEGAYFAHLSFAGRKALYSFDQFSSTLNRPDVIGRILKGKRSGLPAPRLSAPPTLTVVHRIDASGLVKATLDVKSTNRLKEVLIFQDGRQTDRFEVGGYSYSGEISFKKLGHVRWITAVAFDENGHRSLPAAFAVRGQSGERSNRLHVLTIGIDKYDALQKLDFAVKDARAISRAVKSMNSGYYSEVLTSTLLDEEASADRILQALEEIVGKAGVNDTILLHIAGHGARGTDRELYLATTKTRARRLDKTALSWKKIAAVLSKSSARLVILLDACHAGQAERSAITNDEMVAGIKTQSKNPVVIFAASKGRQLRQEIEGVGGYFSHIFAKTISSERDVYDVNKNGVLEISELYQSIKSYVVNSTNGEQTPWLVRKHMIGDFALF